MRETRPPDRQRTIPHYTPNDAPYFITFNLEGAIPISKRTETNRNFRGYENLLHLPVGIHWLRDPLLAQVVYDKLMWLAGEVDTMHAFTIMSNHVHLMMSLHPEQRMSDLLHLTKGATSHRCNQLLGRKGKFWQSDRYDRVLRRNECGPVLRYILNNPVKAGLVHDWRDYRWTYLNEGLHFVP